MYSNEFSMVRLTLFLSKCTGAPYIPCSCPQMKKKKRQWCCLQTMRSLIHGVIPECSVHVQTSADHNTVLTVLFGLRPSSFMTAIAWWETISMNNSITGCIVIELHEVLVTSQEMAHPLASSIVPVPTSQLSIWPPKATYWNKKIETWVSSL